MTKFFNLILFSSLFILLSSCQTTSPEPTLPPVGNTTTLLSASEFETAKVLYESNCRGCHQENSIAPAFKDHLPKFSKVPNGQTYLINALLFGVAGPITASGKNYNGAMPSRANNFDDVEIALLLNYGLTAFGNSSLLTEDFKLITASDVAKERQTEKTASDVLALRNALTLP